MVSVIIPQYNCALLIRRCLDSVFSQNEEVELIVIDDGSTDQSLEIIQTYPKPIRLVQQKNCGPATARSKGITMAKGEYLAFLDADDYWLPGFLTQTCSFLDAHPMAVAVSTGQIHKIPGKEDIIAPTILKDMEQAYETALLPDFFDFWGTHNHVCTGSVLMRTDVVKKTGGQRPELRITEDLEFWAYLATFGPWGFIPEVLFVSDGGALTRQQGWWEKNKKRWASAPDIKDWEVRIISRLSQAHHHSYEKARGRITKNLAYAALLSGKSRLARSMVNKHAHHFPSDKLSKLLRWSAQHIISWKIVVSLLCLRERYRKI